MNFGAFLGGAAQGAQAGMSMMTSKKYADAYGKNAELAGEKQGWERDARAKAEAGLSSAADSLEKYGAQKASLMTTPSMNQGQVPADPNAMYNDPDLASGMKFGSGFPQTGYAQGGLVQIPNQVFQGNPQGAYAAGGLSRPQQEAPVEQSQQGQPQQQVAPDPNMSAAERFSKALMNSGAMNDPKALDDVMKIATAHGLGDQMKPFLNNYYAAKERGMVDGAQSLMNGQVDGAMESLARGGLKLDGPPVKVKPDDGADHNWTFSIGGKSQTMNVADMLARTVDFGKFRDYQMKQREQTDREKGTEADIGFKDRELTDREAKTASDIKVNNAQIAGGFGRNGGIGGGRAAEKLGAVMKHRDGIIDDLSSVKDDETGKFEIDPQRRQLYSGYASDAENMLEQHFGRELTADQHYKLNSMLRTAPPSNDPVKVGEWSLDVAKRFGVPVDEQTVAAPAADTATAPAAVPAAVQRPQQQSIQDTSPGQLGRDTAERVARPYSGNGALHQRMLGVQKALQNPNLDTKQRTHLAMQAQQIAMEYERQQKGR